MDENNAKAEDETTNEARIVVLGPWALGFWGLGLSTQVDENNAKAEDETTKS